MALFSYIFVTVWFCFWVGLMYNQPHRSQNQKMKWISGWALLGLLANQLINRGVIHLLPHGNDPMQHAYYVMYLFSASSVATSVILFIGFRLFRRQA
jgi:hypothetical protein